MLEYMREQGFKTFNNLINESYDKDPVSVNRIDNTIDQAVKLLDHTLTNADTVKSIVTHNYNMLLDRARHQLNELKQHLDLLLT
jgi:archaellum component FlaC